MDDNEKQALISSVIHGERNAASLAAEEFVGLLDGLSRMYFSRIFNCVDASGKWDTEWGALSEVFARCKDEILNKLDE